MEYLRAGRPDAEVESTHLPALVGSWKRPRARVAEGAALGRSGVVTSCQDTSDGLKATLETIAQSSGVGITVREADLPVPPEVTAVCDHLGMDDLSLVMGDSVDFELVFTVPRGELDLLRTTFGASGLGFHPIGVVTEDRNVVLERSDGSCTPLPGKAWRHAPDTSTSSGGTAG
jgi:thiamine-monophosphate kinase